MTKKSVFKTDFTETSSAATPEALFHTLRGRAPEIKHLWSHQADLLRVYHAKHASSRDVAIELPTGSGKTLVGLLIAEWRRQALGERVAYVCPTRQLARQVGRQALQYSIRTHVLIGRQRDYAPQDFAAYQSGRAVAVTTYSAIFNVNPRIADPHTLILDDAHAGESFIVRMWSVDISREGSPNLYRALVELVCEGLPPGFCADILGNSDWDPGRASLVEVVAGASVRRKELAIRDLLDEHLEESTSPRYAWDTIKDHLTACNVFVSWDSILIRPFVPPTRTHPPFSQAKQRVYMSATLGAGGELERVTGVRPIKRLPIPSGWDKRGTGRRLFLIPEISMSSGDAIEVATGATKAMDRSLILVPSQYDAESIELEKSLERAKVSILKARDIEDSIDSFVDRKGVALLLSRYDGLDLPDDTCRMLVLSGLPSGTNLQERFLWSRIAAFSLLRDRTLTRITQGVGRCTRSDSDYAIVFLIGRRLIDFVLKSETLRLLPPELQAELAFGIRNSEDTGVGGFRELWDAFLSRGDEWGDAESAIVALRERSVRYDDPTSQRMSAVVDEEIAYQYAMWSGELGRSLEHARNVADALGGDETKAYRAWWYYLSAEAAMALHETTEDEAYKNTAMDLLARASECCIGVSWFARLARSIGPCSDTPDMDELAAVAVEVVRSHMAEWGTVGARFERQLARVAKGLQAVEHKAFHQGLQGLGEMLGFRSELPDGDGAPDCLWSIASSIHVVFEAKSEHAPGGSIGVNDIRQAESHRNWVRANRTCEKGSRILTLVVSPRTAVAAEGVAHAGSLCHVTPQQLHGLFDEVAAVLRRVRSKSIDLSDEKVIEELFRELGTASLTPHPLLDRLGQERVSDMGSGGGPRRRGKA